MVVFGDLLHSTAGWRLLAFNEGASYKSFAEYDDCRWRLVVFCLYQETMEEVPEIDFILIGEAELTLEAIN